MNLIFVQQVHVLVLSVVLFILTSLLLFQFWQNMGMFAAVSNDTQHALSVMLEDENFVDSYVSENKRL